MAHSNESLRDELLERLEQEAVAHGIDIVDVEIVGSQKQPLVRVRIDHEDEQADPISLDEVSAETQWISDLIDQMDPIEGSFMLEVSSPGMARPLRKERDFARFAGENVSLLTKATEGRKRFTGRLDGIEDGVVSVTTDEDTYQIPLAEIKSCTIKPDFKTNEKKPHGRR